MARSGRPEFAIALAVIGILVALGVPSIVRGERLFGWLCLALAAGVLARVVIVVARARR